MGDPGLGTRVGPIGTWLVAGHAVLARTQQLEPVKSEIDKFLQWKVHHAQHVPLLERPRALNFTPSAFIEFGERDITELRRASQRTASVGKQCDSVFRLYLIQKIEILIDLHRQYDRVVQFQRLINFSMRLDIFDNTCVDSIKWEILPNPSRKVVVRYNNGVSQAVIFFQEWQVSVVLVTLDEVV